jgi:hypothetical protein
MIAQPNADVRFNHLEHDHKLVSHCCSQPTRFAPPTMQKTSFLSLLFVGASLLLVQETVAGDLAMRLASYPYMPIWTTGNQAGIVTIEQTLAMNHRNYFIVQCDVLFRTQTAVSFSLEDN